MPRLLPILLILALGTGSAARAALIRTPFLGPRPMGMGNAYIALGDDKNALWYNPAGLTQIKGYNFDLYDAILSADSLNTFNRLREALISQNKGNALRADKQHGRFGFYPTFYTTNVGFGAYYHLDSFIEIENFELPEVDLYGVSDLGLIFGLGIPVNRELSLGVSVRAVQRWGVDVTMGTQEFLDSLSTTEEEFNAAVYDTVKRLTGTGLGLGVNLGMLYDIPFKRKSGRFRFAMTMEDVGDTRFSNGGGYRRLSNIQSSTNVGTAVVIPAGNFSVVNLALDLRNLFRGHPTHKSFHFGAEAIFFNQFSLRAGINQGYPTFGLGYDSSIIRVALATYASELGTNLLERFHRWYVVQVTLGLSGLKK